MNKSKKWLVFGIQMVSAAVLVLLDLWFKKLAVANLMGKEDVVLIKNFLALSYAENTGAAFSIFSDSTLFLSIVTLVIIVAGVIYLMLGKVEGRLMNICAVLILAGGAGNLVDRFAQGYVVDYIKTLFIDFPVFNFADILVVVGVFVVCGYLIYDIIREEKQKKKEKADGKS
ncbi:MAG: signal peptidase II [Clostridia bacterium]|nr:signal peptidase II [Clostridia bacterium]